jgi:uncharacterized protein
MESLLPLFPLGTVALPGTTVPLHVFEDRYRALVADLLAIGDPEQRHFGIVAIREGYEVGSHEARSMYRTGCLMRLTTADRHADGRYDVAALGQARFRVLATDTRRPYVRARVELLPEDAGGSRSELASAAADALAAYEAYRAGVGELSGADPGPSPVIDEVTDLSYALGAATLMPLPDRQQLLEAPTARARLALVRHQLEAELRAMRAVPSLPATEIAMSGWSPN